MPYKEKKNEHYKFDISSSASSQDCTGLIPATPETMEQYESYNDIMNFEPPMLYYEDVTNSGNKI